MTEENEVRRFNDMMQLLSARRRTLKLAAEYHLASAAEATLEAELIDADMKRGRALEQAARAYSPPPRRVDESQNSDGNWIP